MQKVILPALAVGAVILATQAIMSARGATQNTEAGWYLLYEGPLAKLAYGLPESDQLALMLTCSPGDSLASLYGDIEPDLPSLRTASLGPQPIDPLSEGEAWHMTLALDDPHLLKLASKGLLNLRGENGPRQITATSAEQVLVQDFLSYCAMGHA